MPQGRRAEDFSALKNPTDSAGFERANLGIKGQHATPRPPKPLYVQNIMLLKINLSSPPKNHKSYSCTPFKDKIQLYAQELLMFPNGSVKMECIFPL